MRIEPIFRALFFAFAAVAIVGCSTGSKRNNLYKSVAPTGTLRIGVVVGPTLSAFWTKRIPNTRRVKGVAVDLGVAIARQLSLPFQVIAYRNSGEITDAGVRGNWDIAIIHMDQERQSKLDFSPPYYLSDSTYLVPPGSAIRTLADVDQPGVRVFAVEKTTTARAIALSLKRTHVQYAKSAGELEGLIRSGQADAVGLGRQALQEISSRLPGSRVLVESFHQSGVGVAVPKGRGNSVAVVRKFIEDAKRSGLLKKIIVGEGLDPSFIAPLEP